jgi:hypothetical protein
MKPRNITVTRYQQLCPVTGEWWAVFWNGGNDDGLDALSLDDLTYRNRIIAWAIIEEWEAVALGEIGRVPGASSVVAVIIDASNYCVIGDFLREITCDETQLIGYFTKDDLQNETIVNTIKQVAMTPSSGLNWRGVP